MKDMLLVLQHYMATYICIELNQFNMEIHLIALCGIFFQSQWKNVSVRDSDR